MLKGELHNFCFLRHYQRWVHVFLDCVRLRSILDFFFPVLHFSTVHFICSMCPVFRVSCVPCFLCSVFLVSCVPCLLCSVFPVFCVSCVPCFLCSAFPRSLFLHAFLFKTFFNIPRFAFPENNFDTSYMSFYLQYF